MKAIKAINNITCNRIGITMKLIMMLPLIMLSFSASAQTSGIKKTDTYFSNPIFKGDYPDPSILRDGSDYYMVHSSFESYPGLLIWHSKDLVNWTPAASALHKYVGSVWAPDFVKYKNKYYIYFPANNQIYVVTADDINGKWSDPVALNINGIDPGHVVDEKGNRYLYFPSGGYVPLAEDGLSVTHEMKQAYSGWPIPREWTIECFCMEGPKLTKRGEYYYLTVAEGGTAGPATSHMVVSARSKSPFGPWENSPNNPIIKTKSKAERWWSKGHGTILEDANGKWWMIFHAYEKDFLNMGRQTLLLPIEWTKDGWYKIPDGVTDDAPIKRPSFSSPPTAFTLNDSFSGDKLKPQWRFFGEYNTDRFKLLNNSLVIKGKGSVIGNSSPLLVVPSDHSYTAEVEMTIEGKATGGLVLFYNNSASSGILADSANILANLRGWQYEAERNALNRHVFLRLKNINNTVDMYYSLDGKKWIKTESSIEISGLNHNALGGFLSVRIGLASIGEGTVSFKNFKYNAVLPSGPVRAAIRKEITATK
jgi:xylan 1,4-beta-xylosidase